MTQLRILIIITFCLFYGLGVYFKNDHLSHQELHDSIDFTHDQSWVMFEMRQNREACSNHSSGLYCATGMNMNKPTITYIDCIVGTGFWYKLTYPSLKVDKDSTNSSSQVKKEPSVLQSVPLSLTPFPPSVITSQGKEPQKLPKIALLKPSEGNSFED